MDCASTTRLPVGGGLAGGQVRRYTPDGELMARVSVEATQPSCCAVGGSDGAKLYITTAREGLSQERVSARAFGGSAQVPPARSRSETKTVACLPRVLA